MDASCRYAEGTPEFFKLKISSRTPAKIQRWIPEGRQSAMTLTYSGACLSKGCILTGDDFGYAGGPPKYEILEFSATAIKWRELSGNMATEEIRIIAQ